MKKILILLLALVSISVSANSITFRKNNVKHIVKTIKEIKSDKENLKKLEIHNVWRKYKKNYVGVYLYTLLDEVYGKSWRKSKKISFKALDGYTQTTKVSLMIKMSKNKKGLIAISEDSKSGFTTFEKNGKQVELGPFYLVWSNFSEEDKASHTDALKWPYQLKEINLID
jgi:hypothetical protein